MNDVAFCVFFAGGGRKDVVKKMACKWRKRWVALNATRVRFDARPIEDVQTAPTRIVS